MVPSLCVFATWIKGNDGIGAIFSLKGGILISGPPANSEMSKN